MELPLELLMFNTMSHWHRKGYGAHIKTYNVAQKIGWNIFVVFQSANNEKIAPVGYVEDIKQLEEIISIFKKIEENLNIKP